MVDILTIVVVCGVAAGLARLFKVPRSALPLTVGGLILILLPPAVATQHPMSPWSLVVTAVIGTALVLRAMGLRD